MKIKLLLLILLAFFSSCQKKIEIKFPVDEPKLVINSFFCTDSIFKVHVSKTSSFHDTSNVDINNAICKLYKNEEYLFDFVESSSGIYFAPNGYKPEEGVLYKIKVSHNNFQNVWAEDSIPSFKPVYKNMIISDSVVYTDWGSIVSKLNFELSDPKNTNNYYNISLTQRIDSFAPSENSGFMSRYLGDSQQITVFGNDLVLTNENLTEYIYTSYPFSDEIFAGNEYNFDFNYSPVIYINTIGYYTLFVNLTSVSRELYNYQKKLIQHTNTQEGDFWLGPNNPVLMYSNVHNGYGIFGGYNQFVESIKNY